MKITTKLLKKFGQIDCPDENIVDLIKEHIGEVDYHRNLQEDYENIVIAEIKDKKDHPDAEKLGVYQIDYGTEETIQVVAGDRSLQVGDKVVYMKIGSIVPYSIYTEPEPFEIKAVKLRGILSNGMMGSEKELNIGTDHKKVFVLPKDAPVGELFSKYYHLVDTVIDIENKALTNRGDLFGIIGLAREVSAILGNKIESPEWFSPSEKDITPEENCLNLEIINDAEALCSRYTAITLDNITVKESPLDIKSALFKCGIKPINNVVDITNYISLVLGQPMHAFDYDKLVSLDPNSNNSAQINIRMARQGEKILALDNKVYNLNDKIMVIADSTHPIAIAGVIGGKDTEVDDNTRRIILESANFDKSSIRRTSMHLGAFTDAATKFKHFLDAELCPVALLEAVRALKEQDNCKIASSVIDIYKEEYSPKSISVTLEDLNRTLGSQILKEELTKILTNLEYTISGDDPFVITVPSWRRDVNIKEDIYEDLGRISGYNNIELDLPKKHIKPPRKNKIFELKQEIRNILSNSGANETLTYSFTDSNSFDKCLLDNNLCYKVKNPLSPELSLMRTSIVQSLLPKTKENIERGFDKFVLYELNIPHLQTYIHEDKLPIENWTLGMVLISSDKYKTTGSPFYAVKGYLERIFKKLSLPEIQYDLIAETTEVDLPIYLKHLIPMYDANTSAFVSLQGTKIGIIGELNPNVKNNFKLPQYTGILELNLEEITRIENVHNKYQEKPVYPSFIQDLCFECETGVKYKDLIDHIDKIINSNDLWGRIECLDIYQKNDTEKKKITFRIEASNYKKTLTEKDIKEIIGKIKKKIEEKQKAKLV